MRETKAEIIILDEWVSVSWNASNKKKYVSLGYRYTKMGDKFKCLISDLNHNAHDMVLVKCPICNKERRTMYCNITKSGDTLCRGCLKIKDLSGMKFGRLTAISVDFQKANGDAYWFCECECGNRVSVQKAALQSGTFSCGCYKSEVSSAIMSDMASRQLGRNHPRWNQDKTDEERLIGRKYPEYTKWVNSVLARDKYTCQICGATNTNLEVHHKFSYAHYPEFALDVDNGLSMCKDEHKEFHEWMGGTAVECIPSDIDRWLYSTAYK